MNVQTFTDSLLHLMIYFKRMNANILAKKWLPASLAMVMIFVLSPLHSQQIFINEFMASNSNTIADEFGTYDDWVELYNGGNTAVNIAGMYLSDNAADITLWQIPATDPSATTIQPGGFLLLWFDKETAQGPLHIDAKLGSGGEDIVLTAADGVTIIDSYTYDVQLLDVSEGRVGNGNPSFDFFAEPTPGASNNTTPGAPQVASPTVDNEGGFYNNSITVTISGEGDIYYTTDGSRPTTSSSLYTTPLTFSENTPLRIMAFDPPSLPSRIVTHTYLFDVNSTFPVVSYVADPVDLFDPVVGMYTNWEVESIEIEANAEMWEPDGSPGFNILFESEIHGTGSAVYAQKPLALKAKKSLGAEEIDYEVFPDQPGYKPRSLILRNAGQDWNITMFRDAFVSSLVRDLSDVGTTISKPKLYTQGHRPGIAYVNGEYWGINNIRERMDKRYIKAKFNLDDDQIDFLENELEAKEGDFVEWNILKNFLETNSLTSQSNLDFVASKIDLDHYIDYVVFNLYIDNQDWPGNNNKRWRERVPGAKWNFMTWDLDFSYGLYIPGEPFNSGIATSNSLSRLYEVPNYLWPNPEWATLLFRKLMENTEVRADFVNRMADQLNVLYTPDRVNARIDEFVTTYSPEIQPHHDRWSSGYQVWDSKVQKLRDFANARINPVRNQFVQQYSNITGTGNITVNLNNADNGSVYLNTIEVSAANAPFTGVYFRGVDVPVRAKPNRGYVLQSWSGGLSGNDPNELIDFNSNSNITANFVVGSTSTQPIVINEINYNSPDNNNSGDWIELYNPNSSAVNISGWYFEDAGGDYFGLPANTTLAAGAYLVLVENEDEFNNVYPSVTNYIAAFGKDPGGFGLSGGGEQITIKNANGVLIDLVDYDDTSPWPTAADGGGPTLQLIDPSLNNALASSWEAKIATPGQPNDAPCTDNDNDGVCAQNDCDDNDPALPTTPGSSCNDGNANTTNDVIQADGCTCAGTPIIGGNDCDDIVITATANSISIGNINAAHYIIKLFSPNWSTIISCVDCTVPQLANGLSSGTYHVDVQLYTSGWQNICTLQDDVEVGGVGCTDNDNDGFCVADDCNDNDPNIPAAPGTPCNDNNANTENDVIQSDGCTCEGTSVTTETELGCDVSYTTTPTSITINGLTSNAHASFALFNGNWQTQFNCFDNCADPLVLDNLPTGDYILRLNVWNASWSRICDVTEFVDLADSNNLSGQGSEGNLFFNATKNGRSAHLSWVTNDNEATESFVVEKSLDGSSFEKIATMESQSTQNEDLYYQTTDEDIVVGANYYRLRQIRKDGSERLTAVYRLSFDVDVASFDLFPNPANDRLFVNLKSQEGAAADLFIYNQLGQALYSLNVANIPGQPIPLSVADLQPGMYHLTVKIEGERLMTKRFIIAR